MEADTRHEAPQAGPSSPLKQLEEDETMVSEGGETEQGDAAGEDATADEDAEGEVLYYQDEDGNIVHPSEVEQYMQNVGGTQEETQGQQQALPESEAVEAPHGDDEAEMQSDPGYPTMSLPSSPEYGADESEMRAEEELRQKQEEEERLAAEMKHRELYERPFKPSSSSLDREGDQRAPDESSLANGVESHSPKQPNYRVKYELVGHNQSVSCVKFSPSGKWLLTAGADGRVLLYALHADGSSPTFVVSYTVPKPPPIRLKPNQTQSSIAPVGSAGINDICFSPDSRFFACASDDKLIRIWPIEPHPRDTDVLDESMHPSNLVNGDALQPANGHVNGMQINGRSMSEESTAGMTLSDATVDKPVIFAGHTSFVFCVAYTPQGNLLASGSYDETVKIWDVKGGKCLRTLPAHADPVSAVGFSGDGTILCSAGHDGLLRLWDTASGQCLKSLVDESNPPASHAVFTPNSRYILVSSLDSTLRLWDYHAALCIKTYAGHKNLKYHIPAIFSMPPKGTSGATYIVTGSEDGTIAFYDLQSRNIAFQLTAHDGEDPILALAVEPHSGMIASSAYARGVKEHSVKLWVDRSRQASH